MDKLLEALDQAKIIDCVKMQDKDGNNVKVDPTLASITMTIYNSAVDKCKEVVAEYFNNDNE